MPFKSFLGAMALAASTGLGAVALLPGQALAQTQTPAADAPAADAAPAEAKTAEIKDMVLGSADAAVTIYEYASFTCPHCATWHEKVFKDLKRDYIDTGKVKLVYREVYFDRPGLWAAMVARCGGDMRYFGIQDMLFGQQREWLASNDMVQIVDNLRKIGLKAGLTGEQLDSCLKDGDAAQAMMTKFETDTKADDINSTPSFVVDGQKYGNMAYAELKKILDEKLQK